MRKYLILTILATAGFVFGDEKQVSHPGGGSSPGHSAPAPHAAPQPHSAPRPSSPQPHYSAPRQSTPHSAPTQPRQSSPQPHQSQPHQSQPHSNSAPKQAPRMPQSQHQQPNRNQSKNAPNHNQSRANPGQKHYYTNNQGKRIEVHYNKSVHNTICGRPASYYNVHVCQTRYTNFCAGHNYYHPWGWYCNRPFFYVGGGYSSAFWWLMLEWSAERRALWFYNNQYIIAQDAYAQGIADAQVAARVAELQAQGVQPDPGYVDPELRDNPDMMYDNEYVNQMRNDNVNADVGDAGEQPGFSLATLLTFFLGFSTIATVSTLGYVVYCRSKKV